MNINEPRALAVVLGFALIALAMSPLASVHARASRHASSPVTPPATGASKTPSTQPAREKLTIAGKTFELEIAATEESRARGLMHRDHIDEYGGMLFVYPAPGVLEFWMKNCPIEMDIVFIDAAGTVVSVKRMQAALPHRPGESDEAYDARLPRYSSERAAQFAIELQAGTVRRLKIKPGQTIEMDVKRLKAMAETETR